LIKHNKFGEKETIAYNVV